jgi:hypothetical protein
MRGGFDRDDDDRERETTSGARQDNEELRVQTPTRHSRAAVQEHRPPLDLPRGSRRELVRTPRATYSLRGRDVEALTIIGTFRIVDASDLQRTVFQGNRVAKMRDLTSLEIQGLLQRRRVVMPDGRPLEVVALTRAGQALMDASRPRATDDTPRQRFHSGFLSSKDLAHDAALYPMVERERSALEERRARVTRVVLENELRETVVRTWHQARRDRDPDDAKRAVAEAHALPVINGRYQLPDVRLEYEHANGERDHVDLELVTRQYPRRHLNHKEQSGFHLYAARDATSIDRRIRP